MVHKGAYYAIFHQSVTVKNPESTQPNPGLSVIGKIVLHPGCPGYIG
jgi:hypothetical protein